MNPLSENVTRQLLDPILVTFPATQAVYVFGSRVNDAARDDSDLDVAILVQGYTDPIALFDLAGRLSDIVGCPVDLLDFRAASTIMQYQVLMNGVRLWARHVGEVSTYEAAVLSEKLFFDEARAPLIKDVLARGRVYG
jgi:predicted nucleotidyltransferase